MIALNETIRRCLSSFFGYGFWRLDLATFNSDSAVLSGNIESRSEVKRH